MRLRGRERIGVICFPLPSVLPLACLSHVFPGLSLCLTHPSSGQVSLPVSWDLPSQAKRAPSFYIPPGRGDRWFLQKRARPDWRDSPSLGEQLYPFLVPPIC